MSATPSAVTVDSVWVVASSAETDCLITIDGFVPFTISLSLPPASGVNERIVFVWSDPSAISILLIITSSLSVEIS